MKTLARVAIVGRPNVGKSTLFNRITGKRSALVHSAPGVTRDVQRMESEWAGVAFEVVDTGGLFSGIDDELVHEVEERALAEALSAEVMIFVTDGEAGMTPGDSGVAEKIRGSRIPVFLAVNKMEKTKNQHAEAEFYKLGVDVVHPISALHGLGIGDLLDDVVALLPKRNLEQTEEDLKLAIVGRPNVGKSSLINALTGRDASIVDSRPGTTRDSVDLNIRWRGRRLVLVDTAGIKRRSRTKDGLSALTALKSIDAISRCDIAVLVLDASGEIANQDIKVASYAHKAGKGVAFCVNKWDLVEDKDNSTVPAFEKKIRKAFSFMTYAPILFTSALTVQRVSRLLPLAWKIKESRESRVTTGELNTFLEGIFQHKPPPTYGGGNGKVYYGTQVDVSPPTFSLFVNRRSYFARSYLRFLNNQLRSRYGFEGTLIRIKLIERDRKKKKK